MQQELGTITVTVSCEVVGDVDAPTVAGPPSLGVEIDLPVPNDQAQAVAVKYLREIVDRLS